MKQAYTVILLYPDYASENYGEETYMTSLEADSVADAQEQAQREVAEGYLAAEGLDTEELQDDIDNTYSDWLVIAVIAGRHPDIKEA